MMSSSRSIRHPSSSSSSSSMMRGGGGGGMSGMMEMMNRMREAVVEEVTEEVKRKYTRFYREREAKIAQRMKDFAIKTIEKHEQSGGGNENLQKALKASVSFMKEAVQTMREFEQKEIQRNEGLKKQVQTIINQHKRKLAGYQQEVQERQEKRVRIMNAINDDLKTVVALRDRVSNEIENVEQFIGEEAIDDAFFNQTKEEEEIIPEEEGLPNVIDYLSMNAPSQDDIIDQDILNVGDTVVETAAAQEDEPRPSVPPAKKARGGKSRGRGRRRTR